MQDTIIITSIYSEFWGTEQFWKSCEYIKMPVFNSFKGNRFTGNGDSIRMIYEALQELRDTYKYAIYSDGADTFFVKPFQPPFGKVIYSAEKACYPIPSLASRYPECKTPWKYLNGGNYCGDIETLIKFFEQEGLNKFKGAINGQLEQSTAFLHAYDNGFPIELDYECKYFQSIAFEDPGDFSLAEDGKAIVNNLTGSHPCVYHGNGRTNMNSIYQRYNL